ncbi:MAG TPA: lysophospholipid acyltransferase family protein, partial [Pirellulales bacterium]|nr:lysophospholipid acyltransferase family protein [Pirellulales bacterium]
SLSNEIWHEFLKFLARLVAVPVFQIRHRGRHFLPRSGGGLILSNHQSNLDPILIGLGCQRRLNYVARRTLLRVAPLRWLLNSLDTIPIDREGSGFGGLKETLKRLKRGELVLLFPEGTRTPDGEVHAIKPGFCAIARRSGVPLIPMALDGAFEAWPRHRSIPRPAVVHVEFGEPIAPEQVARLSDDELVREVERRIRQSHESTRRSRKLAAGSASKPLRRRHSD